MICSSVNLLFFMSVILHDLTDFSTLDWYGWRGAGHLMPMRLRFADWRLRWANRPVQRWVFSEATIIAAVPRDFTAPLAGACVPNGVR
jgi:hypothetical protein